MGLVVIRLAYGNCSAQTTPTHLVLAFAWSHPRITFRAFAGSDSQRCESGASWSAPCYGRVVQQRACLNGAGETRKDMGGWRQLKSIFPSFLCGLGAFYLLPTSPSSLLCLRQKTPPAPPAQPGCSAPLPMKAKLIAGEFAARFRSVSEFYVVFGNERE